LDFLPSFFFVLVSEREREKRRRRRREEEEERRRRRGRRGELHATIETTHDYTVIHVPLGLVPKQINNI
jgi:hypothetical protein